MGWRDGGGGRREGGSEVVISDVDRRAAAQVSSKRPGVTQSHAMATT